ncbi:MAG: pantoate--beta-alanine ligase [Bacteroidetes bacterium]|nr:pantoate--beta-alanine ligase [Bacteroidota bacterium]
MDIFKEIEPLKAFLKHKWNSESIGLVPTMGALHEGHLSLIEASKRENQLTVATIFVNPTQFNNPGDLAKYPRTLERDLEALKSAGCDVVFAPEVNEMYRRPSTLKFDFGHLDKILEGEFRPGHFSGVGLVVSKLFHIVQPTVAYFGQKDFQQFKIIEKLVEELDFNVTLRRMPIFRESDGLAMSSRNQRLNADERKKAIVFYEALQLAKGILKEGKSVQAVKEAVKKKCEAIEGVKLEYFELAEGDNLTLAENVSDQTVLLIAGFVGEIRLIDNLILSE